jgi:hypothetical protein
MHVSSRTYKVHFINKIIFLNIPGIELKNYTIQKKLKFIYFKQVKSFLPLEIVRFLPAD